jgi:3-oxoacyl-[acyl-carrier-protein] synthase II
MKLGEGYGLVVLERQSDAQRRGAKVYASVAGWGESADAHHLTQPHPNGEGAAEAMRQAIDRAQCQAGQIDLIAAHATATPDNDAAEYAALSSLLGERLAQTPVVAFKSHLGHTLGGAGAVELILSMMALQQQIIPPCCNVTREEVEFADLSLATGAPKRAAIGATLNTSLGFGGANPSIVLRPARAPRESSPPSQPLRRVIVTGIGVMLPGISGLEAFEQSLDTDTRDTPPARIDDAALEGLLPARRVRRMSTYVKLQLAAVTLACRDAGVEGDRAFLDPCPAILGAMHGAANYSEAYYRQIVEEGLAAANPMLFAEGVPNAGAAHVSLMLGLRGACQSVIGTQTAGLDALGLAMARPPRRLPRARAARARWERDIRRAAR